MDVSASLRTVGRYSLLYGGGTTLLVMVLTRSERAVIGLFVAGLLIVLVVRGLGDVRTASVGTDDAGAVVDTTIDVRNETPQERKLLFYGLGLAASALGVLFLSG